MSARAQEPEQAEGPAWKEPPVNNEALLLGGASTAPEGTPGFWRYSFEKNAWTQDASGSEADTRRRQRLYWGGGHSTYMGSDVHHWGLRGGFWSPSYDPDINLSQGSEGRQGARPHHPGDDAYCRPGPGALLLAKSKDGKPANYCFDPRDGKWYSGRLTYSSAHNMWYAPSQNVIAHSK